MSIEIVIPNWRPTRLNEFGRAWGKSHRLKKADREMVCGYTHNKPKATTKRRVDLHIVLTGKQQEADGDAYWKSLLDALVYSGMLVDDSTKFCEPGKVTYSRGDPQTIITLTDL